VCGDESFLPTFCKVGGGQSGEMGTEPSRKLEPILLVDQSQTSCELRLIPGQEQASLLLIESNFYCHPSPDRFVASVRKSFAVLPDHSITRTDPVIEQRKIVSGI
jgi:hypothetical protein